MYYGNLPSTTTSLTTRNIIIIIIIVVLVSIKIVMLLFWLISVCDSWSHSVQLCHYHHFTSSTSIFSSPTAAPMLMQIYLDHPVSNFSPQVFFGGYGVQISHPWRILVYIYMCVSKNRGTPKSSILTGFFIINHPFWGTPIFGNTHIYIKYSHILHHYCCPRFPESQLSSGSAWSFTEQAALIPPPGNRSIQLHVVCVTWIIRSIPLFISRWSANLLLSILFLVPVKGGIGSI